MRISDLEKLYKDREKKKITITCENTVDTDLSQYETLEKTSIVIDTLSEETDNIKKEED